VAKWLFADPDVLILDEPTSGLDPLVQQHFAGILADEAARGATIFLLSHVLSEVQRLCRRVAIVKEGRLIACEDIASLRQKHLRKVVVAVPRLLGPADFPSGCASAFSREADTSRFLYAGDGATLVRELARFDVQDLLVEEPTLEEIFLHFYRVEARS
jgi:ABC-2 type transport system ATP-binding protein